MIRFSFLIVITAAVLALPLSASASKSGKTPAKAPAAKKDKAAVCVKKLNVIEGCEVCGAMMEWLKKGGIKLEMSHVDQGAYPLYPTVQYSDGTLDHGERMYKQEVQIPAKICVVSCSSGTN